MSALLRDTKAALRREIRGRMASISAAECTQTSALVSQLLLPHLVGEQVLVYAAFRREVNVDHVLIAMIERVGACILPRVDGTTLVLHRVTCLDDDLVSGAWGIREPRPSLDVVAPMEVSCAVVPGVAFDRAGGRLGRGRGYYDRLLPGLRAETPRIGVAHLQQVVPVVPRSAHDVRVTQLVTVHGARQCAE